METDRLIDQLAGNVSAVGAHAVPRRVAAGLFLGGLATLALVILWLGVRPDLADAVQGEPFWMKLGYTVSLAALAIAAVIRLGRPEASGSRWLWLLPVPVLLLIGLGVAELARVPRTEWLSMWLGLGWLTCLTWVLTLAAPIFIGLLWSFRRLAPTRLRLAGATAGLASGALAATLYCLHCPEVSALFVLTWYSLGILLAALAGALGGPRLLRW